MKVCRVLGVAWILLFSALAGAAEWRAGVARVEITPTEPTWMAGFAARNRPAEGTIHPLWAKALVIEAARGDRHDRPDRDGPRTERCRRCAGPGANRHSAPAARVQFVPHPWWPGGPRLCADCVPSRCCADGSRGQLRQLQQRGKLEESYPCPVQVVQFGDDLALVALAGEVTVDYALRLRRELPGRNLWIAGYSNEVFAYVPSERVLSEGGYEGGAMVCFGLHGPFRPGVENRIIDTVKQLLSAGSDSTEAPARR